MTRLHMYPITIAYTCALITMILITLVAERIS